MNKWIGAGQKELAAGSETAKKIGGRGMMTLGSLFDGIGGWQLAAVHAGVKPIWSSE